MAHQIGNTSAYSIFYYASDVAAIAYGSNAGANSFVLFDKATRNEVQIIRDTDWDDAAVSWVRKYDATDQPQEVWSDAYGFYDKHFRLLFDGTTYKAYDFVTIVSGKFRVGSDNSYFKRWMPIKPTPEYSAANPPPVYLP